MSQPRLTIELVPRTAWWSNVRSEVSRADWEVCKAYSKTKTNGCCIVCDGKGRRYPTEAHEIWEYDDDLQVQTLVDIVPLCPECHRVKHLGRTRTVGDRAQWQRSIDRLQQVNQWPDWKVERYVELMFLIWDERSKVTWDLDISFLQKLGLNVKGLRCTSRT